MTKCLFLALVFLCCSTALLRAAQHNAVKKYRRSLTDSLLNILVVALTAAGLGRKYWKTGNSFIRSAKHLDLVSEHFYAGEKKNITEHVWQIPNEAKRIADAHWKYRKELSNFKDVIVPITLDEWNYWYGKHLFGEFGTRYFVKDELGIAAGLHEFARQSDMYFMANYAQTVNVSTVSKQAKPPKE
jgi:alpha-N-arabinofuranosidase